MITAPTPVSAPRRHLSAAITLAGAGILTAHLVIASPEYPEPRSIPQQVQLSAFSMSSAALVRPAMSTRVESTGIATRTTALASRSATAANTIDDIGNTIKQLFVGAAGVVVGALFLGFLAVTWFLSALQSLTRPQPASPTTSASAAAAAASGQRVNAPQHRRERSHAATATRAARAPIAAHSTGRSARRHADDAKG
ncbi:hypothetical protein [Mycobacterium sp. DL592]|uniref:hypothetical protein n=1 Tax=Mycobacterium sp. DL592 TaxID=2675524 RepID=UPI00142230DB|nr:hypothetical protein [Mycobacterium sp. DL592]